MGTGDGGLEGVGRPGFWQGRRVLVTGHTGFKGGWLCHMLARQGATITGLALDPPTHPSLYALSDVAGTLEADLRIDIRNAPAVTEAIAAAAPETVIHLAAQSLVLVSYARPVETFATNVMGTAHVLTAAAEAGAKAIVIATTDKVYENREWPHPYREPDRLGGHDPYASSKACAELLTASLRASLGASARTATSARIATTARIATVRAGNVIGGGDFAPDRIVPDCIRAFAAGTPVTLRNPDAVRPFQHALDPLAGYLTLAEHLLAGHAMDSAWNFGPDPSGEATVATLADALTAHWPGATVEIAADAHAAPHEAATLRLDSTKARTRLGWRPRWPFDEALAHTAAWYRAWHRGDDLPAFTRAQIEAFAAP